MSFGTNTSQSNLTSLALALETTYGNLPAAPIWIPVEPNSYDDFGADTKTKARSPIVPDRQKRKGNVIGVEAAAGFEMDFTQVTPRKILEGVMFANWRNQALGVVDSVDGGVLQLSAALDVPANSILFVEGLEDTTGQQTVVQPAASNTATAGTGFTDQAAGGQSGIVYIVGADCGAAELTINTANMSGTLVAVGVDFTLFGIIAGQSIWLGGDAEANKYGTDGSNGWYRVQNISATELKFDRIPDNAATDDGTGKNIYAYFGDVLRTEPERENIVCKSYTAERTLSSTAYQYVSGCVFNQLEITIPEKDIITMSTTFVAQDDSPTDIIKAGTRLAVPTEDAFDSATGTTRMRMINDRTNGSLYTFVQEASLSIDNGAESTMAVGRIAGFDVSIGDFMLSGSVKAYFNSIDAVQAARSNDAFSLEWAQVMDNKGWFIDAPYLTIGDGRPTVEKDKPITLPFSTEGAKHPEYNHTLIMHYFNYLPTLAHSTQT